MQNIYLKRHFVRKLLSGHVQTQTRPKAQPGLQSGR